MLRRNDMKKYKKKDINSLALDRNQMEEDDKYILNLFTPINLKEITDKKNFPYPKFEKFVDDVLLNKKMGEILYSTNASKEIEIFAKMNSAVKNEKSEQVKEVNNPNEIVLKRKIQEALDSMINISNFEKNQTENHKNDLMRRCETFSENLKIINYKEKKKQEEKNRSYRKNEFIKIFKNIEKHPDKLPNVKLNNSNVFSRLYHNAVYIPEKIQPIKKDIDNISPDQKVNAITNVIQKSEKLKAKNVITAGNGKEFTIKITDELFDKCFTRHSGGPKVRFSTSHSTSEFKNNNYLLELKDDEGNTFLHHCAETPGLLPLTKYLLVKGVNVNEQNKNGDTPLHVAIRVQHFPVIIIF